MMEAERVAVVGGGPAGLMAAETLAEAGLAVSVFDAMPSFGRKFLLAGKSGLNITHAEDYDIFASRFGRASRRLRPSLDAFAPSLLRRWAAELGIDTFVGSSGRVFPVMMKASPLLRAWLRRLQEKGVAFHPRHRWSGFSGNGELLFETPEGERTVQAGGTILALGGASWPRLGSDGAWSARLADRGIAVRPFRPANCGFDVDWPAGFADRFAGEPVKSVRASSEAGTIAGEFVVTRTGIEGSLVYAHSAALRDRLAETGRAVLHLDLAPDRGAGTIAQALARQPSKASLSNRLRKAAGLSGVKGALLRLHSDEAARLDPQRLALLIKALPLPLARPRPIAEAISTAGGIAFEEVDDAFMLRRLPGTFVAGEMLDWEAPTGGYLLTACFATGRAAARGLLAWRADMR